MPRSQSLPQNSGTANTERICVKKYLKSAKTSTSERKATKDMPTIIAVLLIIGTNSRTLEYMPTTVYNRIMNKIQRLSLICSGIIVLFLIFATAAAFVSGKAKPGALLRRKDPNRHA